MGIHGLYVEQLTPEELAWFDAECKAGRAHRRWNWAGLAKVDLNGPEYCLAVDEDTPCACGATKERGRCCARKMGPPPTPTVEVVMVPAR